MCRIAPGLRSMDLRRMAFFSQKTGEKIKFFLFPPPPKKNGENNVFFLPPKNGGDNKKNFYLLFHTKSIVDYIRYFEMI